MNRPSQAGIQADRADAGGRAGPRAWLVWSLGALLFGYGFLHRVAPSVMIDHLMRDFQVGGALLGNLSAFYFYAYAALQIPVGLMVDRWGPRRLLGFGALLCTLGSLVFALAERTELVYLARLLIGAGAGFGFVSTLKLAASWFPVRRFAALVGATMAIGMAGGFLGQAPLAALVDLVGWREALGYVTAAGLVLSLAIWFVVRDAPDRETTEQEGAAGAAEEAPARAPMGLSLAGALRRPRNWAIALIGASMTAPLLSFAGLWGVAWLMQVEDLTRPEAAATTSLLLIGWAVGSPLAGVISDRLGRRRRPLVAAACLALASIAALFYLPGLGGPLRAALFLASGFFCGAMAICFALVREDNPQAISGTAIAFINTAVVASGALFQPLLGAVLDWQWDGTLVEGVRVYGEAAYRFAFSLLIAFLGLGIIAGLFTRETGCQPYRE